MTKARVVAAKASAHDDPKLPRRGLMGRTIIVPPHTPEQNLEWMRSRLAECQIDKNLRSDIDNILRRVLESPRAREALWPERKGRKRAPNQSDIALHYLVLKDIYGPGKSVRARQAVAKAWGVKQKTVADTFTDHKSSATYWLKYWTDSAERENAHSGKAGITRNGVFHAYPDWTPESIREALAEDLSDRAKRHRSGK